MPFLTDTPFQRRQRLKLKACSLILTDRKDRCRGEHWTRRDFHLPERERLLDVAERAHLLSVYGP